MEVATILIGVAVFIVSALMIYCISAVSMKEKTFEEAIAEQRERQEKEREKAKADKKAEKGVVKKTSFKKGKQEKVKEKFAQVSEPELKAEHKMVNLEIEPEIIEPVEAVGLSAGIRQRSGKKDKVKSILLNKDEPPLVASKQVELQHKVVPKDEMELKKSHEKQGEKAFNNESHVKEKKITKSYSESKENLPPKNIVMDVKEDLKQKHRDDDRHTSKPKQTQGEMPLNGSKLVSAVKSAKLSDDEIQSLIDILLNRQGLTPTAPIASESWNKKSQKGDPISTLKKQLEEKEKLLQEEKNNSVGLISRAKEMKNELTAEKSKTMSVEKRYQEQLLLQHNEIEALKARMQHTHEQHLLETNNLQARLHQAEKGSDRMAAQKLSEENKILQETLTLKAQESVALGEKIKQLERDLAASFNAVKATEAAKKGLESKTNLYEDKIRKLESMQKDVDFVVSQRVEEVTHELRSVESRNASLTKELQSATGALTNTQGEVTALKAKLHELESHLTKVEANKGSEIKLQESERKCSDLEKNVKNLEKQISDLSQRLDGSSTEVLRLQQENKSLTDANKIMQDKLQNAPASTSNGGLHESNLTVSVDEHERILSDKAKEVSDLSSGLENQKKTISDLQNQLGVESAKVKDLESTLSQQKERNNELRAKNRKAMEALEKSEKALKSARDSDIENHDKLAFQGLFPDIKVSEKLPHKEWVTDFQKQAAKNLSSFTTPEKVLQLEAENKTITGKITDYEKQISELQSKANLLQQVEDENKQLKSSQSSAPAVDMEKYAQLEAENKALLAEVDHYRTIVSDTESKLRQLEKSIDEEEKKWHEKLRQAKADSSKGSDSLQRISELKTLVSEQEGQTQEYRRVLSLTEEKLKELQGKVGAQESLWHNKLVTAEKELSQTKNEFATVKQQLNASSHGSQEMKTKIERLESELGDAREKLADVTEEKETALAQLSDAQNHVPSENTSDASQELVELRTQLEAERKKSKDLSMNVVKLNGIIKTGQDALSQEQGLVKKLQQSLDSKSMSSGISDIEESEQLRAKLIEKQRLLEKEMSANKQLSERLAASSNENGTSV